MLTPLLPLPTGLPGGGPLATGFTSYVSHDQVREQIVRIGVNYRFNAYAAVTK